MDTKLYGALDPGEIRVLELHPGEEHEPLSGRLIHLTLDESWAHRFDGGRSRFFYDAISYAWGEPIFDHLISTHPHTPSLIYRTSVEAFGYPFITNNRPTAFAKAKDAFQLPITKSLSDALYRFRWQNRSLCLWADQICINQSNIQERNSQVAMMAQIFATAGHVRVWLGPPEPQHDAAYRMAGILSGFQRQAYVVPSFILSQVRDLWARHGQGESLEDGLRAFATLADKAWFERLWVVQESLMSSIGVVFYCGSSTINQQDLTFAFQVFVQLLELVDEPALDTAQIKRITKLYGTTGSRAHWQDSRNTRSSAHRLLSLLLDTAHLKASDPRDRVFALMSLANMVPGENISVDYNIELPQLWISVARFILTDLQLGTNIGLLLALSATQHDAAQETTSWAPDFGDLAAESQRKRLWYDEEGERNSAAGEPVLGITFEPDRTDPGVVKGKGVLLDQVLDILSNSSSPLLLNASPSNTEMVELVKKFLYQYKMCLTFFEDSGIILSEACIDELLRQGTRKSSPNPREKSWRDMLAAAMEHEGLGSSDIEHGVEILANLCLHEDLSYMDHSRLMACTSDGYIGWVPQQTKMGDTICLFQGCPAPFILRKLRDGYYKVVGDAYFLDLMNGEAWPTDDRNIETIRLK